ncbi:MAG TPA: DUF1622 domain-containing protein [Pyrinomonadaceae bacterium]|nr:DUF1622 domain-containing protein [Pyrinomonadaceae bacterium]
MAQTFYLFAQEGARSFLRGPGAGGAEGTIADAVQWLKLLVETIGALIIGLGICTAAYQFVRALVPPQIESYNRIRLTLARYLALALEFQLGADILSTAIAPSWDQIGKLGAIAVIRTGLNYFLTREMQEEVRQNPALPHPDTSAPIVPPDEP